MSSPLLEVRDVSKRFHIYTHHRTLFQLGRAVLKRHPLKRELWALHNISFDLKRGEKVALIGRNGSGKTTLLRLVAGIYKPTSGTILAREQIRPLFSYGVGLNPYLPVIDNISIIAAYHGILLPTIRKRIEDIIRFAELEDFLYVQVKDLSSGQRQRLLFSVFIETNDPFLAFDESTSMADLSFNQKVRCYFESLMQTDRTILIASHQMGFLERFCHRAIWLEKGEVRMIGPAAEVVAAYCEFCVPGFQSKKMPADDLE